MPDLIAPSSAVPRFSRRTALRSIAGIAAAGVTGSLLSACGGGDKSSSSSSSNSGSATGPITFGSNYSDAAPKEAFAALIQEATAKTGVQTTINTTDHNTFQNNISNYLQGTPDSLATWFAGYRLQFFAAQGLLNPIDDVWEKIGGTFNDAAKSLSKGLDGHYYMVPLYNYPWVVFYNKSVFKSKGYEVPTSWDQFVALAKKMQGDGLVPLAFADKDGWPALGTFDIINLRLNGYDYHIKLMKHEVPWTDPGVKAVFDQWRELAPYLQKGANGRIWQDAAKALENKQAGMMFQGS
ncbi:MAG TPA: ABC transporter substrate-binding protein, partial [Actinoplanes sp.]|nr:ABC transporter substrate-binding protein [Actinoplanes sp.]